MSFLDGNCYYIAARLDGAVICLARRFAVTSMYLLLAWFLMVSYQIFTQTALTTLALSFAPLSPMLASAINMNSSVVVFVCGFAWMFVLSSVVSTLMFGREKRLTIQFLVSLALTFTGSVLLGFLGSVGMDLGNPTVLSQPFTQLFGNIYFAFFYLALPFIFMVAIDSRVLRKKK